MKLIIGFSKPKSKLAIFAHLIRWYEKTSYSHCYIQFDTTSGSTLICQASKGMMNFMSPKAFIKSNKVVKEFEIELSPEKLAQIKKMSMNKAGLPYSKLQIIGILIADLFNLKVNPFDKDEDTFVCSEWVGQVLKLLGAELHKDLSLLTPKDIYDHLEKNHDQNV